MLKFKQKLKKRKFINEMREFLNENKDDLSGEDMNLLTSLCNIIWLKFRNLEEDEKIEIVNAVLDGFLNVDIKSSIDFLKENSLINEPHLKNILWYYFNKYVLKKKLLI